ncbi:MAG: hypothetical protein ACE141_04190 [Bryobacteraceae bacterium]
MLVLLVVSAFAAPTLTTVEDVLYKADGTKFNGVAFIEWKSFQTADFSTIATHSVAVQIVDGLLRVRLVPTTNATTGAYYSVRYHSDGRIQFDEVWAVPPSEKTLHLRDVRVSSSSSGGQVLPPATEENEILESDVVGLVDDLEARPVKGPGFAPSRAAYINEMGELEAVLGSLTDCVRVDGTAGPCDLLVSTGPSFVDAEVPVGAVDGSNTHFTLANAPNPPSSLALFRNGILQKAGLDYVLSGNAIDFTAGSVPQAGDLLICSYRLADASNPQGGGGAMSYSAQVLCSSTGTSTSSTTLTSLGSCTIPANTLAPGDRVDVLFSYSHEGADRTFTFALNWGTTTVVSRSTTAASESRVAGRASLGVHTAGAQYDAQNWGESLSLVSTAGNATDALNAPIVVDLLGKFSTTTTETVTLRNYTVIRYPAVAGN